MRVDRASENGEAKGNDARWSVPFPLRMTKEQGLEDLRGKGPVAEASDP